MNYWNAFWVGGAICAICQIFIDRTKLTPARILVSLVVLGVFLQAVGVYQPLVDYAGAGATVPLLGFGYSLAKGVAKAVAESGLIGVFTGGDRCGRRHRRRHHLRLSVRADRETEI